LFLQLPLLSIILVIFKATRTSVGASIEHVLPLLVFLIFPIKFIVYPPAANCTCVILMLI
jgi:sorbitol-specific phosphotransferase system component IIBC